MTRPLTTTALRRLAERRRAGEHTADLAAEVGMSVNNLGKRWRRVGFRARRVNAAERRDEVRDRLLFARRTEGWLYGDIAEELGMPRDGRSLRCLRMALVRFCRRMAIPVPIRTRGTP